MIRLLLTSGRGPVECRIALRKGLAALLSEAEACGVEADAVCGNDPDGHGAGSALVVLHGPGAEELSRRWSGTLLWVSPSPVRPHHKRKNWFVGVVSLGPAPETARPVAASEVRFETLRAGGPGGQHQNKTESAVRAQHLPTGLSVVAREARSQARNKAVAFERLAQLIKASGELQILVDRQATQAAHDRLERGRPVKRFRGPRFEPD